MKSRAMRRHHQKRIKRKAERIAKTKLIRFNFRSKKSETERITELINSYVKLANNLAWYQKPAGCMREPTKQELIDKINVKEQLKNIAA